MHGKMSSIPSVNPAVIAMIFFLVRHAFLVVWPALGFLDHAINLCMQIGFSSFIVSFRMWAKFYFLW
jgi:hypothetical protein